MAHCFNFLLIYLVLVFSFAEPNIEKMGKGGSVEIHQTNAYLFVL